MKKIVVLGAGFGGIKCAITLEKLAKKNNLPVKIILIEKNRYHTFIPALYEIASASPRVSEYALYNRSNILIKNIVKNKKIDFIKGEVSEINCKKNSIKLEDCEEISFDYLVIAIGSQTNFYDIPGIKEYSLKLKNFVDAIKIRRATKLADIIPNKIVIGGGGTSGIETAAEIISCFRKCCKTELSIKIIEGNDKILKSFPEKVSLLAEKRLKKLNIKILKNHFIKKLINKKVILDNGYNIPYDLFIWAGGIKNNPLLYNLPFVKEKNGLLKANSYLRLKYKNKKEGDICNNIFSIGDSVSSYDIYGKNIPATAQKAISEGNYIAKIIIDKINNNKKPRIHYPVKTKFIIPIGGKWAITTLNGFIFGGFLGWILKNLVELKYLLSILSWHKAIYKWIAIIITFSKND
ncbi:MAG: NAD(P)/FAD-dependent oxidoreductase [Patescibacteria group bacterium]|mgnify:CR=1 FL=1